MMNFTQVTGTNGGFELANLKSRFMDRLYFFADHFKPIFVKFANQNFRSVRIFVFRETTKFQFTLQACQISVYLKL